MSFKTFILNSQYKYNSEDILGSGMYGQVFKGHCLQSNQTVAIKVLKSEFEQEGISISTLREIILMKQLNHPNIVQLIEVIDQNEQLYLIFEYMEMDLKRFLQQLNINQYLSQETIKFYIYMILQAINEIHSQKIMHRDLKTENILIKDNNLKIGDFGLGRNCQNPIRPYSNEVVTLWYRAPEILLGQKVYNYALDIWSIGCIFFELIIKEPLFQSDSQTDQIIKIFQILGNPIIYQQQRQFSNWEYFSQIQYLPKFHFNTDFFSQLIKQGFICELGCDLLKQMLSLHPSNRISANSALKHPYFQDLKFRRFDTITKEKFQYKESILYSDINLNQLSNQTEQKEYLNQKQKQINQYYELKQFM